MGNQNNKHDDLTFQGMVTLDESTSDKEIVYESEMEAKSILLLCRVHSSLYLMCFAE